jgi:hypothetical protein
VDVNFHLFFTKGCDDHFMKIIYEKLKSLMKVDVDHSMKLDSLKTKHVM